MDVNTTISAQEGHEFVAFDEYPWTRSKSFLAGLIEALGGAQALSPNPTHKGVCTFSRTVYYKRAAKTEISLARYIAFTANAPGYPEVDALLLQRIYAARASLGDKQGADDPNLARHVVNLVAAEPLFDASGPSFPPLPHGQPGTGSDDGNIPRWQKDAPSRGLQVPRGDGGAHQQQPGDDGGAPYPDKFAQIMVAIQGGREVEGIREIPDTVVRKEGVTPIGKMAVPRKPWEKSASSSSSATNIKEERVAGTAGAADLSLVDNEFPRLERNGTADGNEGGNDRVALNY